MDLGGPQWVAKSRLVDLGVERSFGLRVPGSLETAMMGCPWPCRSSTSRSSASSNSYARRQPDGTDPALEVVMLSTTLPLRRQVSPPALRRADRALLAALSRPFLGFLGCRRNRFFAQPETLLGGQRDLARRTSAHPGPPGRPTRPAGTVALVIRLAQVNPIRGCRCRRRPPVGPPTRGRSRTPGTTVCLAHARGNAEREPPPSTSPELRRR
jgi:hypothetical protein